jgi:hypothetical protein
MLATVYHVPAVYSPLLLKFTIGFFVVVAKDSIADF